MRGKILELLKNHPGEFFSGEKISGYLGISRTAIWKHIQLLREEGFDIEAYSRKGYRLRGEPDRLLPEKIAAGLKTKALGQKIIYEEKMDSTNERAKHLARENAIHGTIVVAEEQYQGKGRLGRSWYAPFGTGVWFSAILRPQIHPIEAHKLTLVAGVAVARAISRMCCLKPEIKWPNDILINGKKVTGILTEMSAEMDAINFVIIGIGINVNMNAEDFDAQIKDIATSLEIEVGDHVSRVCLLQFVLHEMEELYETFLAGDFEVILEEWKNWSNMIGRQVNIKMLNDTFRACVLDIDATGALVIKRENGAIQHVFSGEVSLSGIRDLDL